VRKSKTKATCSSSALASHIPPVYEIGGAIGRGIVEWRGKAGTYTAGFYLGAGKEGHATQINTPVYKTSKPPNLP
jgi:hypothetical protein